MKDPWGNEKAGLAVNGKINRNGISVSPLMQPWKQVVCYWVKK
jgi:hypothetical protein